MQRAVDLDPKFAAAWAALGYSYYDLSRRNGADWATPFRQSVQAVGRPLSVDANLADAYMVVACNKFRFEWDWPGAEQNFQRAIRLNPGLAAAYLSYGDLLSDLGRQVFEQRRRAVLVGIREGRFVGCVGDAEMDQFALATSQPVLDPA